MKFFRMYKKSILQWAAILLTVIFMFMLGYKKDVIMQKFSAKTIGDYHSTVSTEDCVLCGNSNSCRNLDMLALIVLNANKFSQYNVGTKMYCCSDKWTGCELLMYTDESLTEEELQHKYAPFDLNNTYRLHPDWKFHIVGFAKMERNGTSGEINSYHENKVVYGKLESNYSHADGEYLSRNFCQKCYEKVFPVTREINSFLYDYQTGTVYSLLDQCDDFDVRQYNIDILYHSRTDVAFVIRETEGTNSENKKNE